MQSLLVVRLEILVVNIEIKKSYFLVLDLELVMHVKFVTSNAMRILIVANNLQPVRKIKNMAL